MAEVRFNYISDAEEHFIRRRGTYLVASTVDWVLIESWMRAGIPLEAVLRGIDAAFEKYDRRPSKTRKVNSIAYCAQEVMAAAEEMAEASVGTERKPQDAGIAQSDLQRYLGRNAEALKKAAAKSGTPEALRTLLNEQAATLETLSTQDTCASTALEDLERRLTVMEEKLYSQLMISASDDVLVESRAQAERELAPYRSKMSGPQLEQLLKQCVNKKLLERFGLPRLSLFYM